jgi:hypothetical protein
MIETLINPQQRRDDRIGNSNGGLNVTGRLLEKLRKTHNILI